MVITSTKENGLIWCEKYLTDFQFVSKLTGNGLTIDEVGTINSRYFGVIDTPEITLDTSSGSESTGLKITPGVRNFIIFASFILIFIIIGCVVLIRKYKKK